MYVVKQDIWTEAVRWGYAVDGWNIEDYHRDAITHQNWDGSIIWGPKGSFKSNLLLQLGYIIYGDWDLVLKRIIFTALDFIEVTDTEERIPWLGWDDIATHLPKSLYFTNRNLWAALKANWTAYRPKLNVFLCTAVKKEDVASFILEDSIGELICSKRVGMGQDSFFKYDRWMWKQNLKDPFKSIFRPINIEETTPIPMTPEMSKVVSLDGRMPGVPTEVYKKYWKRRIELSEKARRSMRKLVAIAEKKARQIEEEEEEVEEVPQSEITQAAKILSKHRATKKKMIWVER